MLLASGIGDAFADAAAQGPIVLACRRHPRARCPSPAVRVPLVRYVSY